MSLFQVSAFSLNGAPDQVIRNLSLMEEGDGTSLSLAYAGRVVFSSTAKFGYEEPETTVPGEVRVHFRCLHNNKYLVKKQGSDYITASAEEKEEDVTKKESTVFKVVRVGDTNTMRWFHLADGRENAVGVDTEDPTHRYYLTHVNPADAAICTPIDVDRIIKLPETVCLKSFDDNVNPPTFKYLKVTDDALNFDGDDRHEKEAWFNIFPLNNGDVRIMSVKTTKYWTRAGTGMIVANATNPPTGNDGYFQVVRLANNTIAFINRGATTTPFCRRTNEDGYKAESESGVRQAGLVVEEPVVSRNIEIQFRFDDARIYDVEPRSWLSQVADNQAGEGDLQTTLSVSYTESVSTTFSKTTSVTTELSASTTFSVRVPFIAKFENTVGFTYGRTVETGFEETSEKSETMEFGVVVVVPHGQQRRARILAYEAKCDVPFSYVQTEVLADNTIVRSVLHDGIFKGVNGFEFHVEVFNPVTEAKPESDFPITTRMIPDPFGRKKASYQRIMKN